MANGKYEIENVYFSKSNESQMAIFERFQDEDNKSRLVRRLLAEYYGLEEKKTKRINSITRESKPEQKTTVLEATKTIVTNTEVNPNILKSIDF